MRNNQNGSIKKWIELFNEIIVHSRKIYPEKLLDTTRPSEPLEIKTYRKDTYEPITHGSFNEAVTRASKVLQALGIKPVVSEQLQEYIDNNDLIEFDAKGSFEPVNFYSMIFQRGFRLMCETGNGFIVYVPYKNSIHTAPADEPSTEGINIAFTLVEPTQVIQATNEKLVFRLKNLVEITKGKSTEMQHEFMEITASGYVKLVPYYEEIKGKQTLSYNRVLWYSMIIDAENDNDDAMDVIPAVRTKGIPAIDDNGNLYYDSFFSGFVPWANEAITAFSDDKAVRVINNFPIREEKEEKCDSCNGTGKIAGNTCGTCHGSGVVTAKGPYSVYRKRQGSNLDDPEWAKIPAVTFISPPIEVLQHSFSTWQKFLEMAETKVNVKFIELAQSGVAKDLDAEGLKDFRLAISENVYDNIVWNSLWIMESLLKVVATDRVKPIVHKPTAEDFSSLSKSSVLDQYEQAKKSGVPDSINNLTTNKLISRMFPEDLMRQKFVKTLMFYDPFFGKDEHQIQQIKASGVNKRDVQRHYMAEHELRKIFVSKPDEFERLSIEDLAQLLEDAIEPRLTDPVIEIENIFNGEA